MRCPRQWWDKYIHGNRGLSNSSLVIGSAVHLALSRLFMTEPVGNYFNDVVEREESEIVWKDDRAKSQDLAAFHVSTYWQSVGKYLQAEKSEQELLFNVEDVDLPILAYVDLETKDKIIDFKTTAYFNRKQVRPNKEWIFQQGVYQLAIDKPSEVHVLTRSKTDPVVVPDSPDHNLSFGYIDSNKIIGMVQSEYKQIMFHFGEYGVDTPWPGNAMHDWAGKYCNLEECCAL